MADIITRYKVFIASPGGLQKEREAFRDTIRDYNEEIDQQRRDRHLHAGWLGRDVRWSVGGLNP